MVILFRELLHMMNRKQFLWAKSVGLILLLIGLFWNVSATGGTLGASLQNKVSSMGPDEVVEVIVVMANQPGVIQSTTDRYLKLTTLNSETAQAQTAIMAYLTAQQQTGMVSGIHTYRIVNAISMNATRDIIETIAARADVNVVVENEIIPLPPITESNINSNHVWGIEKIRANEVWAAYGITGDGVVVGSLDTGVDNTHPDISGQFRGGPRDFYDAVDNVFTAPFDRHGHGTHTVGTMVGQDKSGVPIGVAPGAQWIAAGAFTSSGGSSAAILRAMDYMVDPDGDPNTDDAPDIVNNSWGSDDGRSTTFQPAIQNWVALGIFPMFANGNAGPNPGTVGSPASAPEAFGIGSTTEADGISSFSSRGPSPITNEIKPEVSAPGSDIRSSLPGGKYANWNGTSMATPHVSGVVALLKQADPKLTIASIRSILEETSIDLGSNGEDNDFGHGRVDAFAAVSFVTDGMGTLEGKVTEGAVTLNLGDPIAGATLTVVSHADSGRQVQTGPDGTYSMLLPAGPYSIEARREGYETVVSAVVVLDGETSVLNYVLEPVFLLATPSSFADTLDAGAVEYHVLNIANPGGSTLKFRAAPNYKLGSETLPKFRKWLTVTPDSGAVDSNKSLDLNVHVNSNGLANFTYEADIVFESNDPNHPSVILDHTLTVRNALDGKISVTPGFLAAELEPDKVLVKTFQILNEGSGPLQIINITDDDTSEPGAVDATWISSSPRFFLVQPGETSFVEVTFDASALVGGGSHTASILIASTDPNTPTFSLPASLNILAPKISASPLSFALRMDGGEKQDKKLNISNTGNGILRYSVSVEEKSPIETELNKPRAMNRYRSARANNTSSPEGSSFPTATSQSITPSSAPQSFENILADLPDRVKSGGELNVLIAPADAATTILSVLTAFPDFASVDYWDARSSIPDLQTLLAYDVVMTWPNNQYPDATAMGNVLADYVDQGGNVILGAFSHGSPNWALGGRIRGAIYTPFGSGGDNWFSASNLGEHDPTHPAMDQVTALTDQFRDKPLSLNAGAISFAKWQDGELLGAVNETGSVMGLNLYFGDASTWSDDRGRLARNSLVHLAGSGLTWLSVSPTSGEVEASNATELTVTFDTTTLTDSTYTADIIVESNDPDKAKVTIPVNLRVGGFLVVMSDIRNSNPTSQAMTIGWKTDLPADGRVVYGPHPDSLSVIAEDSRGAGFIATVHSIDIQSLMANNTYYYKIESAGNEISEDALGFPLHFTTANEVVTRPGLNVVGLVHTSSGEQMDGANLYIQVTRNLETSQALSALTTKENSVISYSLNLGNLKDTAGQPWILQTFDNIILHAQGGDQGFATRSDQRILDPLATYQDLGVLKLRATINVQLQFPRGFSILSTPGIPANTLSSDELLTNIPAKQIYRWDRKSKEYESSVTVDDRTFGSFPIEVADGYFINVDTLRSYNLSVFSLGDSIVQTALSSGLNIISTQVGRPYTSHSLIPDIPSATEAVRWQPELQAYDSAFEIGPGVIIGTNFVINPGTGYFVRVNNDVTWSIGGDGTGTPGLVATKRLSPSKRLAYLSDYPSTPLNRVAAPLTRVNGSNVSSAGNQFTVTNLTPVSATVVWMTHEETAGQLVYGQNDKIDRVMAEESPGQIHWIELKDLSPQNEYTIQVGEQTHAFTTPAFSQGMSYTVFGRIDDTTGMPSTNALVLIRATDESGVSSLPLAAVTDNLGFWIVNLGNLRTDLGETFVWQEGHMLNVEIANTVGQATLQLPITGESPQSTTVLGASTAGANVPQVFSLAQSFPNPFNPTATIRYQIPKAVHVELTIFNILGQKVITLVNETQHPGRYEVRWSGRNTANVSVASSVYFYRLSAGTFNSQKKMLLLK